MCLFSEPLPNTSNYTAHTTFATTIKEKHKHKTENTEKKSEKKAQKKKRENHKKNEKTKHKNTNGFHLQGHKHNGNSKYVTDLLRYELQRHHHLVLCLMDDNANGTKHTHTTSKLNTNSTQTQRKPGDIPDSCNPCVCKLVVLYPCWSLTF